MKAYDWIIIGAGLTGSALGYELTRQGASVLILDRALPLQEATRYSYGGVAYWSGKTELMRQVAQASFKRYPDLSTELDYDVYFRTLTLVLPIFKDQTVDQACLFYAECEMPPTPISRLEACQLEPLLNPEAMVAALVSPHAHVDPERLIQGLQQASQRLGCVVQVDPVVQVVIQDQKFAGVQTQQSFYQAQNLVVCAGAFTRWVFQSMGLSLPLYFTHAEIIEVPNSNLKLQSFIAPAILQRLHCEQAASTSLKESYWDQPGQELTPPNLDPGVVQLQDGRLRIGQISRTLTDLEAPCSPQESEWRIREGIRPLLPQVAAEVGYWCRCRVAFSPDHLPVVGALDSLEGVSVFSGFSNPFAMVLPLAQRFAAVLTGASDPALEALSPQRFHLETRV